MTKTVGIDSCGGQLIGSDNASVNRCITDWTNDPGTECFHLINPHGNKISTTGPIVFLSKSNLTTGWFIIDSDTPVDALLSITSVANASGGNTTYNGTFPNGAANGMANWMEAIAGFTNSVNNGVFSVVSSTATTITVNNPSGVAETHAATSKLAGPPCSRRSNLNPDGTSPRNLGCTNDIGSMGIIDGGGPNPGSNGLIFRACDLSTTCNNIPPSHYLITNQEIRPTASMSVPIFVAKMDDNDLSGTAGSSHIWFNYDYAHCDAQDGDGTADHSQWGTNRCVTFFVFESCSYCGVTHTYFDRILAPNSESHMIGQHWSLGPLKYVDNWMEGSSSNLFGGGAASTIRPFQKVYDVEVRDNYFTKPVAWALVPTSGSGLALKNLGELKTGTRWLFDGNTYAYSTANGGQKAQCEGLYPGFSGENYDTEVVDITWTNNICIHAVTGLETSGSHGHGAVVMGGRRWNISNNLFIDMAGTSVYRGSIAYPGINKMDDNANTWTCNGGRAGNVVTLQCISGGAGLAQTDIVPGDLVSVTGCSDPTVNTSTINGQGRVTEASDGNGHNAVALVGTNGTQPNGLTVVYTRVGNNNPTINNCVVSNKQGFPAQVSITHNTIIGQFLNGSGSGAGRIPTSDNTDVYALNFTFQDNLVTPLPANYQGWVDQGNNEGTATEQNETDFSSLTFDHNVLINRTCSNYTDPNNTNTLWCPTAVVCSGATADSSCIGYTGMMNGAAYEDNATLYTDYKLVPTSVYKGGTGPRQAHDGTDLGANIDAITNALTLNQYVCGSPCGTGPLPNN